MCLVNFTGVIKTFQDYTCYELIYNVFGEFNFTGVIKTFQDYTCYEKA